MLNSGVIELEHLRTACLHMRTWKAEVYDEQISVDDVEETDEEKEGRVGKGREEGEDGGSARGGGEKLASSGPDWTLSYNCTGLQ